MRWPTNHLIALFVDFENLALGVRDMKGGDFKVGLILKRLLEKGRIVFKRAYCDWSHYRSAVREFHAQGIEMVDIPQGAISGKNSADIRMVVDALDLCYAKQHIDTFVLLSGDSDFSPLVSKLKENDKRVIGCGVKNSTSDLLVANCDEFIYYDDLIRPRRKTVPRSKKSNPTKSRKPWTSFWRSCVRWRTTTTPSGGRSSNKRCGVSIQGSTRATTVTAASRTS